MRLHGGAAVDWAGEACFRMRHPQRGLLHDVADIADGRLDRAMAAGAEFLSHRQHGDGSFRGFLLYPGASSAWLTAHVAFVLEHVPEVEGMCRRAAAWLQSIGAEDGGWGYNRRVAVDSDSGSQALMVLGRFSLPCEEFLVRNLADMQLECGGFPTYPPDRGSQPPGATGWRSAHPEVSAMVAEALRRRGGFEEQVDRCRRWLESVAAGGVLTSYWWEGDGYAIWVQSRTATLSASAPGALQDALDRCAGSPQVAMVLSAAIDSGMAGESVEAAIRRLLREQLSDGSWPCAPCLRVTDPRHTVSNGRLTGRVAADHRRVFSTAHAIAALERVRARERVDHRKNRTRDEGRADLFDYL